MWINTGGLCILRDGQSVEYGQKLIFGTDRDLSAFFLKLALVQDDIKEAELDKLLEDPDTFLEGPKKERQAKEKTLSEKGIDKLTKGDAIEELEATISMSDDETVKTAMKQLKAKLDA